MNSKFLYSALLIMLFGMLAFVSCKKNMDEDTFVPTPGNALPIPAATPVAGSISGIVVDENNTPVNGAQVNFGTFSTTSDSKGIFSFNNVTLDKYISTVTVNRPGYFKAYRSFSANATRNYLSIKLIPKTLSGTVNTSTAGVVSLSNGTSLSFQANSIVVKSTGATYTGAVNVYAAYIDPTSSDISSTVPGSFMGKDANNLYNLQSTGMIAVDLESPAGVALQLAAGLTATIKLPIPSSLLSKAPASIDTWSLDDQGVWKQEGTASKSGNFYQMEVTHFSFWNCDVPTNSVYLTLHVQDQDGNSLTNTLVELTIPNNTSWWSTTYGYTDSLGNVSGIIPAGIALEMNIFPDPYNCSNPVSTQTIGPFTANSSLTVTATLSAAQTLTITGTATDCSSQPLQNGTAVIYTSAYNYYYATIVNGNYSLTATHCSTVDSVQVTVWDNSTNAQGSSGSVAVTGSNVTIPAITACGTTGSAFFSFLGPSGNCQQSTYAGNYIAGTPLTANNIAIIFVDVSVPGTYIITTTTANGMTFSASGIFTATGQQMVTLTGSGTPVNSGTYTFITESMGFTGCSIMIPVYNPAPPQATINLACPLQNLVISGTYDAGFMLNSSNTVSITVNVTSAGSYNIFTDNINGMSFQDSGIITATGLQTIVLTGYGTPQVPGSSAFQLMSSNGQVGCSFTITTTNNSPNASYTFIGAPGTCSSATVNGPFTAGTVLSGQSSVTITVEVITPGQFNITTNTTNGMSFFSTGIFTSAGPNFVTLTATGTPANTGTYTFIPTDGSMTGCVFTVPVN